MEQSINLDARKILAALAELKEDVKYIKNHISQNPSLADEMNSWEAASEKDVLDWEKENL